VFYFFYAEIMVTRKGDLIDVLNTTDAYADDAELYDLAVSCFSSQLSCIPLCRLFTSS
jgi:hypothetical protein